MTTGICTIYCNLSHILAINMWLLRIICCIATVSMFELQNWNHYNSNLIVCCLGDMWQQKYAECMAIYDIFSPNHVVVKENVLPSNRFICLDYIIDTTAFIPYCISCLGDMWQMHYAPLCQIMPYSAIFMWLLRKICCLATSNYVKMITFIWTFAWHRDQSH